MASFFIHFITSFLIHSIVALKVKTGRAARWLRGLLGKKKEKENVDNFDISEKKEKKRQSSAKAAKDCGVVDQTRVKNHASDSNRLRSYASESEKEQNKHAIAVAAATEAAADAAEAAAVQTAKTVVRLTSQGRGAASAGGREKWAAIKIQDQHYQPVTRHRNSIEKFDERNEFHSKRSSTSFKTKYTAFDERPKNVEIDTFKMRSRPCWKLSDSVEDTYFRSSILHALRATPARICTPSYMANTQSFRAKLRSQIAKTRSRPCWKLSDSVEDTYFRSSILHALRAPIANETFKVKGHCSQIGLETNRGIFQSPQALLEYEKHKMRTGELQLALPSVPEPVAAATNATTGSGRARRDAAARAMQGWHEQRHYGYGERAEPIIKDKNFNMAKREKIVKNIGSVKNKRLKEVEHPVKAARMETSKQLVSSVVDVGPPADWVKISVREHKDCFEVYALVPGLLREEVRVQSDPEGRLVITGQPEQRDNPWGITAFQKAYLQELIHCKNEIHTNSTPG